MFKSISYLEAFDDSFVKTKCHYYLCIKATVSKAKKKAAAHCQVHAERQESILVYAYAYYMCVQSFQLFVLLTYSFPFTVCI